MIDLTLPYPVSANRYWRSRNVRGSIVTYVSREAKVYRKQVAYLVRAAGIRKPLCGRVAVHYSLYPQRPKDWEQRAARNPCGWDNSVRCIDLDNAQKILLDALVGTAIVDDRWVWRIVGEKAIPDGDARIVVRIETLVTSPPRTTEVRRHAPRKVAIARLKLAAFTERSIGRRKSEDQLSPNDRSPPLEVGRSTFTE